MPERNRKGIAALAAVTALVAAPVYAQSIDEVCKLGAGEPSLMWYSSQDPAFNEVVIKAFMAKYPDIKTEHFRLPSGALAARFSSERDSGVITADLISLADPMFAAAARDKGWLVDFPKADLPELANLADTDFDRGVAKTGVNVSGITYNTELVGAPITDWKDLLRPEYKGRIAVADPRNVPSFMALFRILRDEYGPEFLTQLADQDLVVVSSAVPGTQQVAAGEYTIVFPNATAVSEAVRRQGAPVDTFIPSMTSGIEYATMLTTGSDSPNAAKCLYNFLYTQEGQKAFNSTTSVPVIPNMEGMAALPADYRDPRISEVGEHSTDILKLLRIQ
ncbi:ABC transporter substrate-binding protein [Paracoccus pantotrophus]|uniref:ABC transporter substrate-binding protein n=1 Tax=Paracoccus pantotrophus TaxID=82367 RepID=UPI00048E28CD|nr:extracellular solute-binding protein [Paracoccus pantotrophus]